MFRKIFQKLLAALVIAILLVSFGAAFKAVFFREVARNESRLKIGFVSDWEYRDNQKLREKITGQAPEELEKAVDYFNREFRPDVVAAGGDFIESSAVKPEKAKRQLAEMNAIFQKIEAPKLYVLGNHDVRSLSKKEVLEALEIPEAHAWQDIGQWRLIALDTNFNSRTGLDRNAKSYVDGFINPAELDWLEEALKTDRPSLVFSHHSFIISPKKGLLSENTLNGDEARDILEENKNVAAVVSGHTPESYHEELNGVHYFVVDTLVNESALGSFASAEISYNSLLKTAEIKFIQRGADPREYPVRWKSEKITWKEKILRQLFSLVKF